MEEKLLRARQLCLEQAGGFIEAAAHLHSLGWPHIVYHLSLLALEEVGKAGMLGAQMVSSAISGDEWTERLLTSHRHKLQWAIWSPLARIDPADFKAAREFAERSHATRLASLYVDAKADLTALPPSEQVQAVDAEQVLSLARSRLEYERGKISAGQIDDLTRWFVETMADSEKSRLLLSGPFIRRYESMEGDARAWATWARDEVARLDEENRQLIESELAKPGAARGLVKPRWQANVVIYTPSHSLRPKVLKYWNDQIKVASLLWTGDNDKVTLQVTLNNNEPLVALPGRLTSLTRLIAACLSIGSLGYFWFERPGFERKMFKEVRDLELGRTMEIERGNSFWGDGRAVSLSNDHVDHATKCMMAYAPLSDDEAQPIFGPYLHGLALIAKSDSFYNFDTLARGSFVSSLAGALRRYGNWNGKPEEFEPCLHKEFLPFMADPDHRNQLFKALRTGGDPSESPLANLRAAKQTTDLYLVHTGHKNWRRILERNKISDQPTASDNM